MCVGVFYSIVVCETEREKVGVVQSDAVSKDAWSVRRGVEHVGGVRPDSVCGAGARRVAREK